MKKGIIKILAIIPSITLTLSLFFFNVKVQAIENDTYEYKTITITKEKSSTYKNNNIFDNVIKFDEDGFEGELTLSNISWDTNYKTESKTINKVETNDNGIFRDNIYYSEEGFQGALRKNGNVIKDNDYLSFQKTLHGYINSIPEEYYETHNGYKGTMYKKGSFRLRSGSTGGKEYVTEYRMGAKSDLPYSVTHRQNGVSTNLSREGSPQFIGSKTLKKPRVWGRTNNNYYWADTNNDGKGDDIDRSQTHGFNNKDFDYKYYTDSSGYKAPWKWEGIYGTGRYSRIKNGVGYVESYGKKVYGFEFAYFKYYADPVKIVETYKQKYGGYINKPDTRFGDQDYRGNLVKTVYTQKYIGVLSRQVIKDYNGKATYTGKVKRNLKPFIHFNINPKIIDKTMFGEKVNYTIDIGNVKDRNNVTYEWLYKRDGDDWKYCGEKRPEIFNAFGKYKIKARIKDNISNIWSEFDEQDLTVKSSLNLLASITTPARAGQKIDINIKTTGYVNKINIYFPRQISDLDNKTNETLSIAEKKDLTTTNYSYYLPINLSNSEKDKPYIFTIVATRRDGTKAVQDLKLEVEGAINNEIKTRIKY